MALAEGEPADISDVWMRILTDRSYWNSKGLIHNKAFGGKAIAPPQDKKDWTLELSGRLLSLVKDIEKESREFCKPPRVFEGIMFQTVENLRSAGDQYHKATGCKTDVIYTPKPGDVAHADLVAYGPTADNKYVIRDWLQDFIQAIRPNNCAAIEVLRR
jgi:hypothetical protein